MATSQNKPRCRPYSAAEAASANTAALALLPTVPAWSPTPDGTAIQRLFHFDNFAATMRFVNAVAEIAEQQEHHPELNIRYKQCLVTFSTHSTKGLTPNDTTCAALLDQLFNTGFTA